MSTSQVYLIFALDTFDALLKKNIEKGKRMRTTVRNNRVTGARGSAKLQAEAKEGGGIAHDTMRY